MKTKKIIILLLIFSGMFFSSISVFPKTSNVESDKKVKDYINKHIDYPDFLSDKNISEVVLVDYSINKKGEICINEINSSSPELKKYVAEKLEKIKVKPSLETINKSFQCKYVFISNTKIQINNCKKGSMKNFISGTNYNSIN